MEITSILHISFIPILFCISVVILYVILSITGALVSVHNSFVQPNTGLDIYLYSNGLHTSFILPKKSSVIDWTKFLNISQNKCVNEAHSFYSFGWGDKAFYEEVPTWSKLTLKAGLQTLFYPSAGILHISPMTDLPTKNIVKIRVSPTQYHYLCDYILQSFVSDEESKQFKKINLVGYTTNDNFYAAKGRYHAFNTCNTWVNRGLKSIGVRSALWVTIDKGIFYQLHKLKHA